MIIHVTYRKRGLSTNQRKRSPHRWSRKDRVYCSWNPRFIQVTRDMFGRSKSGDLRYTKESLPYFVEHCVPRLFDREVLFDLSWRVARGFLLRNIASRIFLDHIFRASACTKCRSAIWWQTCNYVIDAQLRRKNILLNPSCNYNKLIAVLKLSINRDALQWRRIVFLRCIILLYKVT